MAYLSLLDLCKEALENCQYLTSPENDSSLRMNKQQCKLLARKLSETRETLDKLEQLRYDEEVRNGSRFPDWVPAMKELCQVLKRSELLIQDCCCDDQWLKAAIRQGNLKETFANILYNLQWHLSVLCSVLVSSTIPGGFNFEPADCEGKLGGTDTFTLSLAAKQDEENLKDLLKHLRGDHVCDGETCKQQLTEQCLAAKLLEKFDAEALPVDKSSLSTSSLFLWVNPEDLPRLTPLGRGGFGEVRETRWLEQSYAMKIFLGGDKSFRQEIGALAQLNHPNIVRLVCCSEGKRHCFLVMELMQWNLHDLLEEKKSMNVTGVAPFSHVQAVDLMLQIAEAMKYIHSKSFAHRDLKSPNILINFADPSTSTSTTVDGRYVAKVADFGLTKIKNISTRYSNQTPNTGTRRWMAPEVFKLEDGEERPSRFHPMKTDSYSFGIICFELLTGDEPFEDIRNLYKRVKGGERPKLPEDCPTRLAVLIHRCWDGNSRNRPDFREICRELWYIKGLLLRDDSAELGRDEDRVFQMEGAETQGPWGGYGGSHFFDGVATSIRRIKLKYDVSPKCIWWIEVEYHINGISFTSDHGDRRHGSEIAEITLKNQTEYLEQIEGHWGVTPAVVVDGSQKVTSVTSLTFHTNLKTYGPYGGENENQFKSDVGRIVGFFGRSGMVLDQIGIFLVPGEDQ